MIKKLEKHNWRQWQEIRLEALEKSPDCFLSSLGDEIHFSDEVWIERLEISIHFGYFFDDQILGSCCLSLEKAAKIAHTATLFGMYVRNNARGKGIGSALIEFTKDYAKVHHVKHLYLGCNAENRTAVNLYKKHRFRVYGTRPDYTKIGGEFYDDLTMMCEL